MTGAVPDVRLNSGTSIPQVGFGVFRVPDQATERAVLTAIECGDRSIDTRRTAGTRPRRARHAATVRLLERGWGWVSAE